MLYKKKIIRDFLSLFTENYWKQLVSVILEYGIINFKKHHNIASLTPEEIIAIVESLKKDENLSDKKKINLMREKKDLVSSRTNSTIKKQNIMDNKSASRSRSKSITNKFNINKPNKMLNTQNSRENSLIKSSISNKKSLINYTAENYNNQASKSNISIKRNSQTPNKKESTLEFTKNKQKFVKTNITVIPSMQKKNYNSNSDNEEGLKTKRSNVALKKIEKLEKSNLEVSNLSNNTNHPEKKYKKTEILEKKHLNKLKEKKKKNNETDEDNFINQNKKVESINDKLITNSNMNLKKVESKIKSQIESDKKIYKNKLTSEENLKHIKPQVREYNTFNSYKDIRENSSSASPKLNEKFIGDGFSFTRGSQNNIEKNKNSILLLEEKLNGLTQKISKVDSVINYV